MPPPGKTASQSHHSRITGIPQLQALLLSGGGKHRDPASGPKRSNSYGSSTGKGLNRKKRQKNPGVSRKTAWRDLHETCRKIADALVKGYGIKIAGCRKAAEGRCPKCQYGFPG
ncbi:MAG: DUF134 domain-containing protein [Methanoregula sp.]|nr:DUF134 domain-containing protein [Methanoregula sp.]